MSALGIEEQRVNVIGDFIDSPDGLGDGYRVDVRIASWDSGNVLKCPASALFLIFQHWSVFEIEKDRARIRQVEVGQRNPAEVEILSGLTDGVLVVLYPANDLKE